MKKQGNNEIISVQEAKEIEIVCTDQFFKKFLMTKSKKRMIAGGKWGMKNKINTVRFSKAIAWLD